MRFGNRSNILQKHLLFLSISQGSIPRWADEDSASISTPYRWVIGPISLNIRLGFLLVSLTLPPLPCNSSSNSNDEVTKTTWYPHHNHLLLVCCRSKDWIWSLLFRYIHCSKGTGKDNKISNIIVILASFEEVVQLNIFNVYAPTSKGCRTRPYFLINT